jgi:hypothetical protein
VKVTTGRNTHWYTSSAFVNKRIVELPCIDGKSSSSSYAGGR